MDEIFKKEEGYKAPFHTAPKQCIVDGTFTLRLDVMVIKTHFSWNEGWEFDQIYLSFECQTYNTRMEMSTKLAKFVLVSKTLMATDLTKVCKLQNLQ